MEYFTTTSKASRRAVDCVIVGVYERGKLAAGAADIDAASKGHLDTVKLLVKHGANVHARNHNGVTPSGLPPMKRYPDVVEFLKQRGAAE